MLLIGYLYGIKSEQRLEEEVSLNLAYLWFCGIDLIDRVPDHSTFNQNRRRCFQEAGIFREIFNEIVLKCIDLGIVKRLGPLTEMTVDTSHYRLYSRSKKCKNFPEFSACAVNLGTSPKFLTLSLLRAEPFF